jgi:hypothetical protein
VFLYIGCKHVYPLSTTNVVLVESEMREWYKRSLKENKSGDLLILKVLS